MTDQTMIERAAEQVPQYCYSVMEQRQGDDKPDIYRRLGMSEWQELARAALTAMREPTEAMVAAGEKFEMFANCSTDLNYATPMRDAGGSPGLQSLWRNLIDAALVEG